MSKTVREVAEHYVVGQHVVLAWIASGELVAINVSRRRGGKPRWRIPDEALAAFETARSATSLVPRASRRRRLADDVVEFYR